jgi:hypothetical protein
MTEMIIFEPLAGTYDVRRVEEFIEAMPFTFRDPTVENGLFLLCGNAVMTGASRTQLLGEPDSGFPYVALVIVKPEQVQIKQECEQDSLDQARALADWLRTEYPSRVLDGYGTDFTELCRESLDPLYL